MLASLNPFSRGKKRPVRPVSSELFRIDLGPVDEPMTNGHTERMNFTTSERMSLGKGKRVSAQPIGQVPDRSDRSFDWQSVQSPDRWRADQEPEFNGNGFDAEPERLFDRPAPAPAAVDRVVDRRKPLDRLAEVVPESGALTVQGVEKSFGNRMVVRGVSLSLRRGEAVGLLGPNGAGKTRSST